MDPRNDKKPKLKLEGKKRPFRRKNEPSEFIISVKTPQKIDFVRKFLHRGKTEKPKDKQAIANPAPVWKIELGPFK